MVYWCMKVFRTRGEFQWFWCCCICWVLFSCVMVFWCVMVVCGSIRGELQSLSWWYFYITLVLFSCVMVYWCMKGFGATCVVQLCDGVLVYENIRSTGWVSVVVVLLNLLKPIQLSAVWWCAGQCGSIWGKLQSLSWWYFYIALVFFSCVVVYWCTKVFGVQGHVIEALWV